MLILNKRKSIWTSTSKYPKIIIRCLCRRDAHIWLEHLWKLRIRKLQWVLDPDTRLWTPEQEHKTKPQSPELSQVAWYSTWNSSDTSIKRERHRTKQELHWQLPARKQAFAEAGHLLFPARVATPTVESAQTTSSSLSRWLRSLGQLKSWPFPLACVRLSLP